MYAVLTLQYRCTKDRYDSKNKIKKINSPILIMHGKQDNIVPQKMGLKLFENEFNMSFVPLGFVGFLITLATSIRLAKFNIDKASRNEFKGLPSPVNALFIVSLPILIENPLLIDFRYLIESQSTFLAIIIISCILMNINIPFFSLKSISFKNERLKILVLFILSIPLFSTFYFASFPMIILTYILLNLLVMIGRKLGLSLKFE